MIDFVAVLSWIFIHGGVYYVLKLIISKSGTILSTNIKLLKIMRPKKSMTINVPGGGWGVEIDSRRKKGFNKNTTKEAPVLYQKF